MNLQTAVLMLCVLAVAGCAASHPRAAASRGEIARPLVAPAEAGDRVVTQIVRAAVGSREMTFNAALSVSGNDLRVVGVNAVGVRLFTLRYDGQSVSAEKSAGLPGDFQPEWLLTDLQFVFWPVASLQGPLRKAGYEIDEPWPGTRHLRRGEELIAEAHYASADAWTGRSWLVNLRHSYSLQIDSEMQ
jgi:hypothetical protein